MCYEKYKAVKKLVLFFIISQNILPEAFYRIVKPRKKYQYNTKNLNRYSTTYKTKIVCLNIVYKTIRYY
jgi:hypothetical protein